MRRYPVLTLVAISACGCLGAATATYLHGVWLGLSVFAGTTLVIGVLIAAWLLGSSRRVR